MPDSNDKPRPIPRIVLEHQHRNLCDLCERLVESLRADERLILADEIERQYLAAIGLRPEQLTTAQGDPLWCSVPGCNGPATVTVYEGSARTFLCDDHQFTGGAPRD